MSTFAFLVETYRTERLKILSVWAQVPDERMRFRPEPRARSPTCEIVPVPPAPHDRVLYGRRRGKNG